MFGRSNALRIEENRQCEERLQEVTRKLNEVTGTVQESVDSLGHVADRLKQLKEDLDRDGEVNV